MSAISGEFRLRVHGVLYSVEIESEPDDLDWLDRVILDLTQTPQNLSDVIRCFGLPRRLLEDAVGRLVEEHLLLLDVAKAQVRTSGLLDYRRATPSVDTLLVWQDHVSGAILPFKAVREFLESGAADDTELDVQNLQGGPPARTVLEMSDAQLLTHLERYRETPAWSERVVTRQRLRRETLLVRAARRPSGGISILDRLPGNLPLQWGRHADIGTDVATPVRTPLPAGWVQRLRAWGELSMKRIERLAGAHHEIEPGQAADMFMRLRDVLERNATLEIIDDGPSFVRARVQSLPARPHRAVVVANDRPSAWNDALATIRHVRAEQTFVILGGTSPKPTHFEAVSRADANLLSIERHDVDFLFINDRELFIGGIRQQQRLGLRLSLTRPLQELAAWLPQEATRDLTSYGAPGRDRGTEQAIAAVTQLERTLRILETETAEFDDHPPLDAAIVASLTAQLKESERFLNAVDPAPIEDIDGEMVRAALAESTGGRVLVRSGESELVHAADRHEVVIWSETKPKVGMRWIPADGPAEIVILGDVVIIGWRQDAVPGELPPFFAVHAPAIAQALRTRSDRAGVVRE